MNEFVKHLHEVFEQFGILTIRPMFGGYGIYHNGLMFALVADDRLYLKVDNEIVKYFEEEGLEPFVYNKGGKPVKMSYSLAPDAIFDNRELAAEWAQRSYEAAQRVQSNQKSKKKKTTNP